MDKLKDKLNTLRTEADAASQRTDGIESDLKRSEQSLAGKDIEITSVKNKCALLDAELVRVQNRIAQLSKNQSGGNTHNQGQDALMNKIAQIEQQTDEADARLKQAAESNRNLEVQCEQQERTTAQMDLEVSQLRNKCAEAERQYLIVKTELDATLKQFEEFA